MEDLSHNGHFTLKGPYIAMGVLYILIGIQETDESPFLGICSVVLGLVYIYKGIN
jgi:hypothetical protein